MYAHRSQLVWFRFLYVIFSRYMITNTFKPMQQNHWVSIIQCSCSVMFNKLKASDCCFCDTWRLLPCYVSLVYLCLVLKAWCVGLTTWFMSRMLFCEWAALFSVTVACRLCLNAVIPVTFTKWYSGVRSSCWTFSVLQLLVCCRLLPLLYLSFCSMSDCISVGMVCWFHGIPSFFCRQAGLVINCYKIRWESQRWKVQEEYYIMGGPWPQNIVEI